MLGIDRMDQTISTYIINLHTKKWWWPLFQFVIDVAINNAYQIYRQSHLNRGEYTLNSLGFHRTVVDAFYRLHRKSLSSTTLFTYSRSLHHPPNNLQLNSINHSIAKCSQRQCSLPGRKGTSVNYCKKWNVSLYAECFELYHCK